MADDVKIERIIDDNGRRVEKRVYEIIVDGQKERVVETHVEQIPMMIQEKVIEKIAPVVTTRKKEVYKEGKVIDTVVEELNRGTTQPEPVQVAQIAPSNALTKEDLLEVLREVLNNRDNVREVRPIKKKVALKTRKVEPKEEVEEVPETKNKLYEIGEIGLYVLLSGQLAFCLYHFLLKNWL